MVSRDPLTGVYNRRAFEQLVEHAHEKSIDVQQHYCLILVDIDNFKTVNDTHGHPVGDQVLKAIANMLKKEMRAEDIVARIGGDEFAILLPQIGVVGGSKLSDRILAETGNITTDTGETLNVTLSLGIASGNGNQKRPAEIYKNADIALYSSKQKGRNTYTVFDDSVSEIDKAKA